MMKGLAGTAAICVGALLSLYCGWGLLLCYVFAHLGVGPGMTVWAQVRFAVGNLLSPTDISTWFVLLLSAGLATGVAFIEVGARAIWAFWRPNGPDTNRIEG